VSRRRALRVVLVAAAALLVAVLLVVLVVPGVLRPVVVWRLSATLERPVTLSALELELFGGRLALGDLRVMDRDGHPLATLERLEARFAPRDLLRGHLRITEATLQAPTLRIIRTGPGEFNISDLLARESTGGPTLAVTLERLALRGGAVAIEDRTLARPQAWRVEAVTLDARDVSTRAEATPGVATLGAVAAGSPISLWVSGVRLSPLAFQATVIAREIDGSLAALYLPPQSPLSPARARLDVTATIAQDPGTGTRLALDAVFAGVELRRPGGAERFLSAPAVRVTVEDLRFGRGGVALGRLGVDAGRVVLEDARLAPVRRWQADGITLEARNLSSARDAPAGVASLHAVVAGSPLSVWVADLRLAPLELHATAVVRNVDFALFRLYVPRDLPVQPERGVVNASVRAEHDARRGTRLALDAGLQGVEVRRPKHFVTAPALRVTAEDIAFGGGAVRVGRFAVGSARLTIEDRTLSPPRTWAVQDLHVEATRLSSRREDVQGVATARATVAGASVAAWITHVRLEPLELRATAILRNLDLTLAQLYVPATVPAEVDRGVVNASVQVDHEVATGTRLTGDVTLTGVQARGREVADRLALSARSLRVAVAEARWRADALDVGRVELTGSDTALASAAARLDLERLSIASEGLTWPVRGPARVAIQARFRDGGEVDTSGTALLTAPPPALAGAPPTLAWATELAVTLKAIELGPIAALVPAARGVGGRVDASLTATMARGASLTARVQGDLGGTRLALVEGGRTLLALRRLEATGLDVLWPERIGVGRLRLRRPRALVEIDRQGMLPLVARFATPVPPGGPGGAPTAAGAGLPAIAVGEIVVERGSVAFADERGATPIRFDLPRVDATLRELRWPASTPAHVRLDAALPAGGTVAIDGSVLGEPRSVDLRLAVADADLGFLQPYGPFRAAVRAKADARLAVSGPLAPTPRLHARGAATLRSLALADGQRPVLTVERLEAMGIDATWPERVTLDTVRVRRSWALIERDGQGRFLLRDLLARPPGPAPPAETPAPPGAPALEFRLGEGIFEEGAATIVDGITTPPARFEVTGTRLAVQDFTWPARGPLTLQLSSPMPGGGRLDVGGTMTLDPVRLEARATLDGVELGPAQPYLPIEGRVSGRVTGDLTVALGLDPIAVQVTGQARLQRFRLSDGDRPLVTAGRAEAVGIDVDWPRRVRLERFLLRFPRLLIERSVRGEIALFRLVTPRRPATPPADSAAAPASPPPAPAPATPSPTFAWPTIEIGTVRLERGVGRFVDQTLSPPYAEELSRVEVTVSGLTTTPGRPARFTGGGALGGGGAFTLEGEATADDRPVVGLKVDLRDVALPRANPYLERYTTWTATRGTLSATASYALRGTQLDARHDVVVRRLEVTRAGGDDEVEERLGLPLGFLVALLKDARGEIRLSIPVSGDLATREFDFQEAVWGAVRALAIRLLALPFSRVGSLFFSEDSKVEAVALAPVAFEPATDRLATAMADHLARVAGFLRAAPAVRVHLAPIATQADLDTLRRERVLARLGGAPGPPAADGALEAGRREHRERWPDRPLPETLEGIVAALTAAEPLPDDAVRDLGTRRLEVVRRALTGAGIEAARLSGAARRASFVEAGGTARVELDLRP
jgi:hypothetical protein